MKQFLRLSDTVININHIVKIERPYHFSYLIYLSPVCSDPYNKHVIEIDERKKPNDFNIVSNFINNYTLEQSNPNIDYRQFFDPSTKN